MLAWVTLKSRPYCTLSESWHVRQMLMAPAIPNNSMTGCICGRKQSADWAWACTALTLTVSSHWKHMLSVIWNTFFRHQKTRAICSGLSCYLFFILPEHKHPHRCHRWPMTSLRRARVSVRATVPLPSHHVYCHPLQWPRPLWSLCIDFSVFWVQDTAERISTLTSP